MLGDADAVEKRLKLELIRERIRVMKDGTCDKVARRRWRSERTKRFGKLKYKWRTSDMRSISQIKQCKGREFNRRKRRHQDVEAMVLACSCDLERNRAEKRMETPM